MPQPPAHPGGPRSQAPAFRRDFWRRITTSGFFEIHAQNYLVAGGPFHHTLGRIRERYPLSIHGVGLSDRRRCARSMSPTSIGWRRSWIATNRILLEHLPGSTHGGVFFNDLLPLPYDQTTLTRVCDHIDQTQDHFATPGMLLENPATYVEFAASTLERSDRFITEIVCRTGLRLLLDVNNAYVSQVSTIIAILRRILLPCRWPKSGKSIWPVSPKTATLPARPCSSTRMARPSRAAVWELYAFALGPSRTRRRTLIERGQRHSLRSRS